MASVTIFVNLPHAKRYLFSSLSVKIAPGAVVCVESEIRGDVTIGKKIVSWCCFSRRDVI